MCSLMQEVRHVNAGSLFVKRLLRRASRVLLRWIGQRISRLLDKTVDDLLGHERYEHRTQMGYHVEGGECAVITRARVVSLVGM